MATGIQLQLLIGPVPLPAPREVVEALVSLKVDMGSGDSAAGFEITFDLPPRSPLRTLFLLSGGGSVPPLMRVVAAASVFGRSEPLVDGMVTNVEVLPGDGGIGQLVVKGKDLSALMAVIDFPSLPYPAMPPAARVLAILAKYAALGVIPMVIPSLVEEPPLPTRQVPLQRGSDLAYVQQLAREAGHVFYLSPGPAAGTSTAYWGPEVRIGIPQPALTTGMDALSNVESLRFTFDREKKDLPIVYFQESVSKVGIPIPVPDINPLAPPLGLVPPLPPNIRKLDDTAQLSAGRAFLKGLAHATRHSDSVFGSGSLDVQRYGRVLKSRGLVGVRGAGLPYDGLYYVKSVSHDIQRGRWKQSFELARNGLMSTVPAVPV
jgi:hypothetical protein